MPLIPAGYWPTTYFPKDYWVTDYWPEQGSAIAWTAIKIKGFDVLSGEPVYIVGQYTT